LILHPYVTVWCGTKKDPVELIQNEMGRFYKCPAGVSAMGTFNVAQGLLASDPHTLKLCSARKYLFHHMDAKARFEFRKQFNECKDLK